MNEKFCILHGAAGAVRFRFGFRLQNKIIQMRFKKHYTFIREKSTTNLKNYTDQVKL